MDQFSAKHTLSIFDLVWLSFNLNMTPTTGAYPGIETRSKSKNRIPKFLLESSLSSERAVFNVINNNDITGDCLFSTIAEFIGLNANYFKDIPKSKHQIRLWIVNYILSRNSIGFQQNWERFYGNIRFNLENRIVDDLSQYGANDRKNNEIQQSYREYMSTTFSELCAADSR